MAKEPLAEVFGFPTDNITSEAKRYRHNALCRFGNKVPNCTKDKAKDLDKANTIVATPKATMAPNMVFPTRCRSG